MILAQKRRLFSLVKEWYIVSKSLLISDSKCLVSLGVSALLSKAILSFNSFSKTCLRSRYSCFSISPSIYNSLSFLSLLFILPVLSSGLCSLQQDFGLRLQQRQIPCRRRLLVLLLLQH